MFRLIARGGAATAVIAAAALALSACGDDDDTASKTTPAGAGGEDSKVAALVPAEVKSKGTLVVAADATYAPNEFIGPNGKTIVGMDADLAKALAATMGLKARVVNATFDSILPGLTSKKYDLGMSSFTDTKEREETVDFVTYFSAGTSFFVKSDGPAVETLDDLCAKKVAVEKGTTQADDANAQAKKCKSAGKSAPKVLVYPDQNGANLALSSGRADVGMADSPVAAYQVKQSDGAFKLSGDSYGTAPYGIAFDKGSNLIRPVLEALKVLIADGRYKTILEKWGVGTGAITNPRINGAIS